MEWCRNEVNDKWMTEWGQDGCDWNWDHRKKLSKSGLPIGRELKIEASDWSRGPSKKNLRGWPWFENARHSSVIPSFWILDPGNILPSRLSLFWNKVSVKPQPAQMTWYGCTHIHSRLMLKVHFQLSFLKKSFLQKIDIIIPQRLTDDWEKVYIFIQKYLFVSALCITSPHWSLFGRLFFWTAGLMD